MTFMTCRSLFACAAAAGAVAAFAPLAGKAVAAAPAPKSTGIYRYKVGDYEII
jgi:hypothetical protein